jgi:hypothetical protein
LREIDVTLSIARAMSGVVMQRLVPLAMLLAGCVEAAPPAHSPPAPPAHGPPRHARSFAGAAPALLPPENAEPPVVALLLPSPAPAPAPAPARDVVRTELRLRGGLHSPMPGGIIGGYLQDTGLDIAGFLLPVYALAAGTLDYSEPGHTRWTGQGDNDQAVRLRLDEPIPWQGRQITHVWYAHLSKLAYRQAEDAPERTVIQAGELLGVSGMANDSPHLHLGLLLDGEVDQEWGTYLLFDEVREVLGGYRANERLPVK